MVREKETMLYDVIKSTEKENPGNDIIADETIRLTGNNTKDDYPDDLRRVTARVEVKGKMHDLVFLTNNFEWAASTIAELYKARWQVELLFKELKQTLQLQDFFGENENTVQECARTEGVGLGERSELRSSRKASRRYGLRF